MIEWNIQSQLSFVQLPSLSIAIWSKSRTRKRDYFYINMVKFQPVTLAFDWDKGQRKAEFHFDATNYPLNKLPNGFGAD
nr:hypothetical protein [Thalassotalea sp. ND16A]